MATARLRTIKSRVNKIAALSRTVRAARKLYTSGVVPQGIWGHQAIGLSTSQLLNLRRMAASCTGIAHGGRCTTTAVFICYGRRGDPIQRVAEETLSAYFRFLLKFDTPLLRAELFFLLAIAWAHLKCLIYDPLQEVEEPP